jgi:PAS domain S-box-containing protein/putative nucleotidyltransferase with HDIG domain
LVDAAHPSEHAHAEQTAHRAAWDSAQLADAAMDLLGCRSAEDVYEVAGDFMALLVPDAVVVVNDITPDLEWFITRKVAGADGSTLARAASLLGFELVGKRWVIDPSFRDEMLRGNLSKLPGGIVGLGPSDIPQALAGALAKAFGIHDVFVIGIADGTRALGNFTIVTRAADVVPPAHIIESFAHHCFSALAGIAHARDLAQNAERNRLLISSMAEGLALHEIILDESGKPCDYRFLEVNPAFEATTGLKAEDIIGRTVREVLPGIEPAWIERYGAVAMTGVSARFEDYSGELGRYYEILAYSPAPGLFASLGSDTTERKLADQAMRASEEKFRAVFEGATDGIFLLSGDSTVKYVNPAMAKMHGYAAEEMLSMDLKDLDTPMSAPLAPARLEQLWAGVPLTFEAEHFCKNGQVLPLDVSASLVVIGDEQYVLAFHRDMTERKRAQEALREGERWLSESQRIASLGHYIYDIDNDTWRGSPSLYDVLGVDESYQRDFAGWLAVTHPEDRDRLARYFNEDVVGKRIPFDIEYRIVRPRDGAERWVHGLGNLEYGADEQPSAMFGIIQDITDRKHTEESLRIYAELLEATPAAVTVHTPEGEFIFANERALEMHGYTHDEFLALSLHEIDVPEDAARIEERIRLISERGEASFEVAHFRKDGSVVPLAVSIRLTSWNDREVILSVATDITERKLAEQKLANSLASIIAVVGQIVETRDPYTAGHERRVSELAARIAEELGMTARQIEDIRVAALIHDVGKISVPAEILSKPGDLSKLEFELIKGHAEAGYLILTSANMDAEVTEMVHQHHERCDCSGYPRELCGDDLLEGAKVLMVADVVEAMVSHRPYRPGLGLEPALAEIERGAGLQYDGEVARACKRVFEDGFAFSEV